MNEISTKRNFPWCVLVCALVMSLVALATSSPVARGASYRPVASGSTTGKITSITGSSFTIQTPGRWSGVVDALTTTATKITQRDYPYVYGGGHAAAGVASVGIPGPGYNGHRIGYDCSGSVAAVLAGGGLWRARSGVPNDAGIISQLLGERLIARGVGTGPVDVTLYDDPGVHIFMGIDGGFFGTSDGGGGGDRRGGPGWLYDGAPLAWSSTYKRYHLLPSALKGSVHSGHKITFQSGDLQDALAGYGLGQEVHVSYQEAPSGSLIATAIS